MQLENKIKIQVIKECGYEESLLGISLNKNQSISNMPSVADRLSKFDGGHNKFLESIMVWVDITMPRYMWSQMDTYRQSTKNSESTMHTILKDELTQDNFEINISPSYLAYLNILLIDKNLDDLKASLPEGFLQRRIWTMSYKTLRNIIGQRYNHKLKHWKSFCQEILSQVDHPQLLK